MNNDQQNDIYGIRISVVVTVHNSEKYLDECLNSILSQTYLPIEILCIDGGSTDRSPCILKKYAEKSDLIRVINDPNTSYGHKINRGIEEARGSYVSVLESDDRYAYNMLERLACYAEKYTPDYVNGEYFHCVEKNGALVGPRSCMYGLDDCYHLEFCRERTESMSYMLRFWTGIYRREFLINKRIRMNESPGASFQDISFRFLVSVLAETAFHISEGIYFYRTDNENASVYQPQKMRMLADEYDYLAQELKKRQILSKDIWKHYYLWKYGDIAFNASRFNGETRKELTERLFNEFKKDKNELISYRLMQLDSVIECLNHFNKAELERIFEKRFVDHKMWEKGISQRAERWMENGVVLFGCGKKADEFLGEYYLPPYAIVLTDSNESLWGTHFRGHTVMPPRDVANRYFGAIYLIVSVKYRDEIKQEITNLGISEERIEYYDDAWGK